MGLSSATPVFILIPILQREQCHPLIYSAIKISAAHAVAKSPGSSAWEFFTTLTDWSFHCLSGPSDTSTSEDYPSALSSNNIVSFWVSRNVILQGWKRKILNKKVTSLDWNWWDSLLSVSVLLSTGKITSYSPLRETYSNQQRTAEIKHS